MADKRIITVTLNPAVDKTIFLDKLNLDSTNRACRSISDIGGKGINVSKTIRALGGNSIAVGFLGKEGSARVTGYLDDNKITNDFVLVGGECRTNMKIVEADGTMTEINEAGPVVREESVQELVEKLLRLAGEDALFVFAGNLPPGAEENLYGRLIRAVHTKGALALLDADGGAFREGMKQVPDIIKPNREEAAAYFAGTGAAEEWGRRFREQGVGTVLLSCGKGGAHFFRRQDGKDRHRFYPALPVEAVSTAGAGDAMTGAFCYAYGEGLGAEETEKLCMAVSAGAVMTEGTKPPGGELVRQLLAAYL